MLKSNGEDFDSTARLPAGTEVHKLRVPRMAHFLTQIRDRGMVDDTISAHRLSLPCLFGDLPALNATLVLIPK